ncbi:MAG: ATP-dependent 6-phosphofructokinase [Lentisphaerae bacterium]|nr:ATP-dependent 6-phosphofructokinase [Lentisphaerota bacterium]
MLTKEDFLVSSLGDCNIPSPVVGQKFVRDNESVTYFMDPEKIREYTDAGMEVPAFERAGAREMIYHNPAWCRAAILTAGGLCPGLNEVIKFLTLCLIRNYGVRDIYGIPYGYRGLNPARNLRPIKLTEDMVDAIHEAGGSILGSSRGQEDVGLIVDSLKQLGINLLFCIGGDGTSRCAHEIAEEIQKRQLSISVVAIPKTIDNDISFIDRTFGFATAVREAGRFVSCAHNEAKGAYNGLGLIKVMGRDSGFIAAYTALANPFINYCLIPEEPFSLDGADGLKALLPHLLERMNRKHHAVIIVAEGAGQNLFKNADRKKDASGNILHEDIGLLLKQEIASYFKSRGVELNTKYFDLGYTIRSVSAEGDDAVFCAMLAQSAAHAAMAGKTDVMVGHWGGEFTHVPIALATRQRKKIDLFTPLWSCVKSLTSF